jgi:dihydroorotate dehydrogenase (NAD+) catalytic subunit
MEIKPFELGDYKIKYPFTIPSGIVTITTDTAQRLANDIIELGIVTTKSIGPEEREGFETPVLEQKSNDTFRNTIGLSNPGYKVFAEELRDLSLPEGKILVTSIFGGNEDELVEVAKGLAPYSHAIEINDSCPHVTGHGIDIGKYPALIEQTTRAVRKAINIPILVKLPPLDYIDKLAKAAVRGGADGIVAINTVSSESDFLTNRKCGMSGGEIRDIGIECVYKVTSAVDVPVIAMAGIKTANDVRLYRGVDATGFGIGSGVMGGMDTEHLKEYFHVLVNDLENGTNLTADLLNDRMMMTYRTSKIKRIEHVAEDLKIFYFDREIEAKPGQFVFTYINGDSEKPFSIADDNPLTLAVRKIGKFTSKLFELDAGDEIGIRGLYGRGFNIEDNPVLVGGGTGAAPLRFLAKRAKNPLIFLGGGTRNQLLFLKEFEKLGEVVATTEDGSYGIRGIVTDALENYGNDLFGLSFYNCGPELMMVNASRIERRYTDDQHIQNAVERYMKCGIGICGACAINGYRSCVDGPVFTFEEIGTALGTFTRTKSGARKYF